MVIECYSEKVAKSIAHERHEAFGKSIFPNARGDFAWYVGPSPQLKDCGVIDIQWPSDYPIE